MFFYLGFLAILIFFKAFRIEEKQGVKFLFFFLAILLGFRSWDLGLYDTLNYREFFYEFQGESFTFIFENKFYNSEIIMSAYTWVAAKVFSEFGGFVVSAALIYIISVYKFIMNWSQNKYLSVLFFFSFYYFYGFYLIKQTIAMSVLLFAFSALNQRKNMKSLLFAIIAVMIHKYSWVVFMAYPAIWFFRRIKHRITVFSILVGVGAFMPTVITNLVIRLDPTNLIEKYIKLGIYNSNAARLNLALIIYFLVAFFGMYVHQKNNICEEEKTEYEMFMALSICAAVFSSYSMIIQEFYRVSAFFGIFNMVFITKIIRHIKSRKSMRIVMFIIYGFLILYSFRTANNMNCIRYRFFFDDSISGHFMF